MKEGDLFARLKPGLEIAGGLAALLAVVGYMSVRSWLNYLGLSGISSFPPGLYLFEAYVFLTAAVALLALPLAGAVALAGLIIVLLRLSHRVRSLLTAILQTTCERLGTLVLVLAPLVSVALSLLILPTHNDTQILLQPSTILGTRTQRPDLFLIALLAAVGLGAITFSSFPSAASRPFLGNALTNAARYACAMAALIMLWCSIVIFNVYIRDLSFPAAVAIGKTETKVACGLLVMSTSDAIVLWSRPSSAPDGPGRFVHIRQSELRDLAVGRRVPVDNSALLASLQRACDRSPPTPL